MQLLALEPAWQGFEATWVTLDSPDARSLLAGRRVVVGFGPTNRSLLNLVRNLRLAWRVVGDHDPQAILSTGAGLAVAFLAPDADELPAELRGVEYQVDLTAGLPRVIERAGGAAHLRRCGHAYTNPFLVPQVAWFLHVHAQQVDLDPDAQRPAVVFHVKHVSSARGRALAWAKRGRTELARAGTWIVTGDCDPPGRR